MNNHGTDQLDWKQEIWDRIDKAVHDEAAQTKVAAKFIPLRPYPDATNVAADTINPETMTVDEGAVTPFIEISVEFALTEKQVAAEQDLHTAVTLATRAANLLSQGEDLLIFQGEDARANPLFAPKGKVQILSGAAGNGLLKSAGENKIVVQPIDGPSAKFGENTFAAVADGYAKLQGKAQNGPYALVLQTTPYADTYAPLANTLVTPADRIKPLVTAGFYGTGTLPVLQADGGATGQSFTGVLVSLGGNAMDLVIGMDVTTAFVVKSPGQYHFRVFERFALRPKDTRAIFRLDFAARAGLAKKAT